MYRTGDRVRWGADGRLEYLGRADFQVKVRGYRIELGEIESALRTHASVGDAVVVVREDGPSGARLVAYVAPHAGASLPDIGVLRTHLGERLPSYMVPSAIVALEALPLSSNGKVDRAALPSPDAVSTDSYVAPRNEMEEALATVWAQVLRVPRVGIHDNFFQLGGDSIISLQLVARARRAGLHFAPRQLFQSQTIATLAPEVSRLQATTAEQTPVVGPVLLTPIQRAFLEGTNPEPHHYNQALMLRLREPVEPSVLEAALRKLVEHHDALRIRFVQVDGRWSQHGTGLEHTPSLRREDVSSLSTGERTARVEAIATEAQRSFDLGSAPLLRAVHFDFGPGESARLLLVAHHLVVDAVSWRILVEDLETLCRQALRGEAPSLPAKTTSFKTWSERLHTHARSEALDAERAYWLDEARARVLPLPRDRAEGLNTVASSHTVSTSLDAGDTGLLLREVPAAYRARLQDVLLAALGRALAVRTGQSRFLVEAEGHGREDLFTDVDLSRTVGWFTSLYPVLLQVGAGDSPGDTVRSTRDALRTLSANGLGHGLLRHLREDDTHARLRDLPVPEVSLNYLGQVDSTSSDASLFTFAPEAQGPSISPRAPRAHLLDVSAVVQGGQLHLSLTYSRDLHDEATALALVESFKDALRLLVSGRATSDALRYTPADFPLARLTQATQDRVLPPGLPVEDVYPLSALQQGMLFQSLMAPGSGVYVTQFGWTFGARIDLGHFRRAWETVVERHAPLRTAFVWEGLDEPLQVVSPRVALPWEELDWRGLTPDEQKARFDALMASDRVRGFDLRQSPLMRLTVVKLDDGLHRVLWSSHHLLMDGWSLGLVFKELFASYDAASKGQRPALGAAPAYRDFISWLREDPTAHSEAHWREALQGFTAPTPLPGARLPDTKDAPYAQGERGLLLSAETTQALHAYARQHQLTANTVLQGAWALVLARYSGEGDVIFGTTVSGRAADVPGIEHMVGLFINTLPLRSRLEPDMPVVAWLASQHAQMQALNQHEHASLARIQAWSDVPRGQPLFQSLYVFENYPVDDAVYSGGSDFQVRDLASAEQSDVPFVAIVLPGPRLELRLVYDTQRFETPALERVLRHWAAALESMLAQPQALLSSLSLVTQEERERVLVEWNRTQRDYPRDAGVHQLFAEQAARTPDAIAVESTTGTLTYRELDERSNQLAHHLRTLGVTPGTRVALCLERSLELPVGLLGILKAGAAFVPLDPAYPAERLSAMLASTGASVLVTQERLADELPAYVPLLVCLDSDWEQVALQPVSTLDTRADADSLAYVMFTSGSTGQPKGVAIPHRGITRLVMSGEFIHFGPQEVFLQLAPISFDASTLEVWGALLHGARLVLFPPHTPTLEELGAVLVRHRVTTLWLTAALFEQIAIHQPEALASVRQVLAGGDVLPVRRVREHLSRMAPDAVLVNGYGPTENTTFTACHRMEAGDVIGASVPIGRPISNTRVYVLDERFEPVLPGAPGELFTGGDGLAWGYLGRPDLTAERFVPHPFNAGERLYRTGDKVRWSDDGTLEFLGRTDFQVKVRGFRIEPGEVESVLRLHASVSEAVVVVREDAPGDKRLVAYVVAPDADMAGLKDFLRQKLPEYMVPSALVCLESLPLTPNGKVDRNALPAPELEGSGADAFMVPVGATEVALASIFSDVLGVPRVGRNDDFFELGGHSLLATQVVSRIRATFDLELALRELFESPTLSALAGQVDALRLERRGLGLPPLVPVPRTDALPLSFAQQRLWFIDQLEPASALYNMPSALRLVGDLDVAALEHSISDVVERHEALRTTFASREGEPVQHIHPAAPVTLPVVDLSTLPSAEREAEVLRLAREEALTPFDLATGPLFRVTLLRVEAREHVLLSTMHHIVSDGWSTGVLVRELGALYAAHLSGTQAELPPLPVQYADFAAWQRGWLRDDALRTRLGYWKRQLEGAPALLELSTDRPRPAVQTRNAAQRAVVLSTDLSDAIKTLSQQHGATPFMTLLAAFQVLLARYSGQDDIVVGSPIAGRNRGETEGLIGFFVNTLALRARLEPRASFASLLKQVKRTTLEAFDHQDVPFEKLVEELHPERSLSYSPLFQVMFSVLNTPMGALELPGLRLEGLGDHEMPLKFDLNLTLTETPAGFVGTLDYNVDLFDNATMARMVEHLLTLLRAAVADPEQSLSALPLMDEAELRRVLGEWNDTQTYVLDADLRPVPTGVPGELYLGDEGLARGAPHQPHLIAERFIPNPFSTEPGARIYRTGDRARWLANGTLEHLGRLDSQVKLRGLRIEPGEVEAALLRQPGVQEAVVLVRDDLLVAYVVPRAESTLEATELRRGLLTGLPEHLVPAAFVVLDALPLSPNGKLDREALPAPDLQAEVEAAWIAPRTPTEQTLAELMAAILCVEQVGAQDSFFTLGGHSLLATQLASRIRAAFQVDLPLRALFEDPTVAGLAARIDASRGETTPAVPPLLPVPRTEALPLSFSQQRLWFIDQLSPGTPLFNLPTALRVEGALEVGALEHAFNALVNRHEVLRTTFAMRDSAPVQRIRPASHFSVPVVDLSALSEEERQARTQALIAADALASFDLSTGPLLRASLLKHGAQAHVLLVTMHHIVSDAWSTGVLVRELATLYVARTTGTPAALPPLPVQYADYAAWQRTWLRGDMLQRQLDFWKEHLSGTSGVLELPTDRPRPAVQSHKGTLLPVALTGELSASVRALAQREGATPFMVLLAAWQLVLARYAGQDDVSVGFPIANRQQGETEGLIGFFVNTLVLRSRIDARGSFLQLLAHVRSATLAAYQHQDLPFEKLVEELQPQRDLARSPLFQATLTLQNTPVEAIQLPGLSFAPLTANITTSQYEVSLLLEEGTQGFSGALNYNTDLFDADTVKRLMRHYAVLLETVTAAPERPLGLVSLLSSEERHQVLTRWNAAAAEYPRDAAIHQLFARQAALTPDAVAVESEDASLTYAQLDARANRLAHHLRGLGVQPGSRVAVHLKRSVDLVVALLGTLKAGAAYVPLDATWPTERMAWVLRQSSSAILLTESSVADELPELGVVLVVMDEEAAHIARQPDSAPEVPASADSLAYVMFTSGSTGEPKGVCVPHRGVVRLVQPHGAIRFGPNEVWLQAAPVAFDASTLELWGALLHGARLVLAPPGALSLEELGALLARHRISSLWLTAALYEQMVTYQPQALTGVSQVLAGGDVLPARRVREHLALLPPSGVLINGYGPTENTTFSATHALRAGDAVGDSVPIGGPVPHSSAFVLDGSFQPTPPGVTGELYVGGDGLAWGYLGRPDLTAERFVPHPFGAPGTRLYRTGDKARWRMDGTLEFQGRADFQVKVRGFRIEPGEVESTLRQHPGVGEAIVVVREDVPGDKRLVAYVVPSEHGLDPGAVRGFLEERLPAYMVPSAIVTLTELPLTANGKVDRKALPPPGVSTQPQEAPEMPRTATEEVLAGIYAEVLGVSRVGPEDDFFELGGHSLLATQVVSRIRSAFNVELPLRELFEAPTVAGLARYLDASRQEQQGLEVPALTPVPRTGALPLSFAQQRLWFIDQLDPGSALYNILTALRLEGTLDIAALERAVSDVVSRHEALRTTFTSIDGQPSQVIHPAAPVSIALIDLRHLEDDHRQAEARRLTVEEGERPFDLTSGPLFRLCLVKLAEREHLLLANIHHIVSDGWSSGVLVRELGTLYAAHLSGEPAVLPPLSVQYADFAAWQRGWLRDDALRTRLAYWKQQLQGAPALLELPTDRPRAAHASREAVILPIALGAELSNAIKALSQRQGATPFMTLLAVFQLLLSRYSGQDDISVGSPIAGRNREETEGLIGFFVNTLVLRARIDPRASFHALLERVRATTLGAFEHQDVPFEKLVEELQPERVLDVPPLFQVMFSLLNTPMGGLELPGLRVHSVDQGDALAKFDLNLTFVEAPSGYEGALQVAAALFDASTAARMVAHFLTLLRAAVKQPDAPVASLPLMDEAEQHRVLVEWNDTHADFPAHTTVHALFEETVARTPDALAVSMGDAQLTFRELDARANQLAHALRDLGVGQGSRVGLYFRRAPDMVVALWATLKAGAAYLPLDPALPDSRIAFLLQDTDVAVVLTQAALADALLTNTVSVLRVDKDWDVTAGKQPTTAPAPLATADDLAYLIYTSGSTGLPKGVMVEHRGVVNYLTWALHAYRIAEGSGSPVHSPLSFDLTVTSLIAPLIAGRPVVLVPEEAGVEGLGEALREGSDFSLVKLTPTHLQLLSYQLTQGEAAGRTRAFVIGGEALTAEGVAFWRKHAPDTLLINEYGPTETVVGCSVHTVAPGDATSGAISIGRPIANTRLYVLDAHLRPVPVGVVGELFIGGSGVARGYWRRPALTAERFIPDAFSALPGARMYRTGDRVRWGADGRLEYLGRADFQVKVRGYRIELGEIESALRTHASVGDAVVVVREEGPLGARLVAYVAPHSGAPLPDANALRGHLGERLPAYMVPSAIVSQEALPLSSNGKVDRAALPSPDAVSTDSHVAPLNATERTLATLMAELLRIEHVGAEDSFFALGGHSILATQLASRIRTVFQVELPLRALFEAPTVSSLAARIDANARGGTSALPPLIPVSRTQALPLSFAQQRLWFIDQLEPGSALYNMPAALRLEGALDADALEASFDALVRRHEALRTTFPSHDGEPVQVIHPAAAFSLPLVDLSREHGDERAARAQRLINEEALKPFHLATGPLLRASLLRMDAKEHVLLVTMHHIVSDGWSMDVLVRELVTLYAAITTNTSPDLAPLPVQYADFSAWQRAWLRGEVLQRQLDYWKHQLADAPAVLELPTDRPRPAVQSSQGGAVPFHLPEELTQSLESFTQAEGATLFMGVLAAFQLLLSRYSGQDDISVGSPIAGRNRAETEGLIGFFVNTLVLRSRIAPRSTFRELLSQVRASTLAAYEHQDVPFEKLVEELHPRRSLSHSPLFQVMLALQSTPRQAPSLRSEQSGLEALKLTPMGVEGLEAKFDLSLSLARTSQGLGGALDFRVELFDERTVARMAGHLITLLKAVVTTPDADLGSLSLLSDAEREQLLVTWNDTHRELPWGGALHERIEAQVVRTPDALAVLDDTTSLTFDQLDRRANRLAHWLRAHGVRPESRVAICMERGVDMIVAVLGVLKAGGAYVPLDPSHPRERLAFVRRDSGVTLILTQQLLAERLETPSVKVLRMDDPDVAQMLASEADTALPRVSAPQHLAYVIYTSGSTGHPKGVMIQHASVMNLHAALASTALAGLRGPLRVSLNAPLAFDASVQQLIQLSDGHTLCVVPQAVRQDAPRLVNWVEQHHVDVLDCAPSHLRLLLDEGLASNRALRVLVGGEAVDDALWERLATHPRITAFNVYGPTECTVDSTARAVRGAPRPSLGSPLTNVRAYVLDSHLQPVPVGVSGELFLAGDGLARGYLARPSLTAERFVPNPFSSVPGARMYRTGDKVRWLPDGELAFLGRLDFQVKLRGFRIELGEIEATLARHPDIREALVLLREDVPGDQRLVAYYTAHSRPPEPAALRAYLTKRLPAYEVPGALMALESFPLTPNGKVDRKALPSPEATPGADAFVAPLTPTEVRLAALWADVLRLPVVGRHDHFFERGGHSLLATRLMSRIRSVFALELPLRALFEAPTLELLALRVERATEASALPPLLPAPRDGAPLPLSFAQQRLWFLEQLQPGTPTYNMPTALRLEGALDVPSLQRAFSELLRRHEALRTSFAEDNGAPFQHISPPAPFALLVEDLSSVEEREALARERAHQDAVRPFDLSRGPLLRASLLRLAPQQHVLLLNLHHAVTDGWSMGLLVREVVTLYEAFRQGLHSLLPELPLQYADYALWQRQWLKDDVLSRQVAWWKHQLAGAPALLELPTDFPRPPLQSFHGRTVDFQIPGALARAVEAFCKQEGATLFMGVLATFQLLLSRYSGQDDISIGSPIAGRRASELEGLIGFFVNTLVLRSRVEPRASFRQLLSQVRASTLAAYEHQDVPFEKLVEELKPQRSLSYSPLFQVMFTLQNTPTDTLEAGEGTTMLSVQSVAPDVRSTHFDLTLSLAETPEGFSGALTYRTDLFEESTITRMAGHFATLLEAAIHAPETHVGELPLMPVAEREQMLTRWNDTHRERPWEGAIHGEAIDESYWEKLSAPRPVGTPLANVQAHVLDARMQPVPLGVPGELFLAGAGVSRGSLSGPGLTAERFLPDPFSSTPGARLYRTGDKVRRRDNGELVYLGRFDDTVDPKAQPAPDMSSTSSEYVAPRNPGEETIAALWRELLGRQKVSATDDFFALGGHSLLAVRLMSLLRERLGVSLPVSALFQASTVERLARRVEQREQAPRPTPNLVRLDTGTSTERPLFLVHGGGGAALGYTELVRELGTQRPIYGLSASGMEGGELPESSVKTLARDYLAQLRTVQPRGPYLLGGWSFGGVVAHEMARLLEATGEKVDLLVLLDSRAPTRQPMPKPDTLTLLAGFGQMLGVSWEDASLEVGRLERLGAREVLAQVLPRLRLAAPALHTLELDTAERLFNVYQRLTEAQRRHVPDGVYTGRTVLFRATRSPDEAPLREDRGWREWLTGALSVHDVAGDHFTMLSAPRVSELVEQLARDLEDAAS
ncbi:non-ribosomal peptide synthase/polyketide synthase [Myxococcus sp. CA033]|uniref:non-ribosomal peptide synthase/polyketide synthase n=1 Tax=Myxococcus sp. CA033 TaxID=2741516 RepID=UPI0020C68430|nr:non-ribosomal peptide synthase/polyketide synthase [Myxococcus sp. CA033]